MIHLRPSAGFISHACERCGVSIHRLLNSTALALLLMITSEQVAAVDLSSEEAFQLMKANDSQFDNVLIEYNYTKYEMPSKKSRVSRLHVDKSIDRNALPPDRELGKLYLKYVLVPSGKAPEIIPPAERKWVELFREGKITYKFPSGLAGEDLMRRTVSRNQMGLRWPDLAVRKQYGTEKFGKFSSIDQRTHLLFSVTGKGREWFHCMNSAPSIPNVYQEQAVWLKLALGVGYSEIIRNVTSFERNGDSYQLKADLDWWSRLTGQCTLELDESLVVRDADIRVGTSRVVVHTDGFHRSLERRFVCALNGRFKKFRGKRIEDKFDVTMHSLAFGITDAEFEQLADMSTPTEETLFENNRTGPVRQVRGATFGKLEGTRRWMWIVPQVVFIAVIAYFVLRKRFLVV